MILFDTRSHRRPLLLRIVFCVVTWLIITPGARAQSDLAVSSSPPQLGELEPGAVQVAIHEQSPAWDRWPSVVEPLIKAPMEWQTEHFLLARIPKRYDAWGIRDAWQAPLLVRLSADVALPAGTHRVLTRVRGLSRLWVDDQIVAHTDAITKSPPDGEEPITRLPEPLFRGARLPSYRQQEATGTITRSSAGVCRVVLEFIVGGKNTRTETGEVLVAVQFDGQDRYQLLQPRSIDGPSAWLIDDVVESIVEQQQRWLDQYDDQQRRQAARSRESYWSARRKAVLQWLREQPGPALPTASPSDDRPGQSNPIDLFIADKIRKGMALSSGSQSAQAKEFHEQVLPLLRSQCFRCHGDKANGGLRLNSRDAMLAGGGSGAVTVEPGDASASELVRRIASDDVSERMPPGDTPLAKEQIEILERWINAGAEWYPRPVDTAEVQFAQPIGDAAFLRRLSLDTIGLPPTSGELRQFIADASSDKRERAVDRLLNDDRLADHWVSYWMDVLAENPTLINASLNSTGPFRWFLHDALRDNKPVDRLVTELILMRGNPHEGGSAGFSLAGENDAPLATKAQIIGSAFLAIEMQCARCHDSPYHRTLQHDLYSIAAMLDRKQVTIPKTSSVPPAFFEKKARVSLIKVSLNPQQPIQPEWPFAEETGCINDASINAYLESANDSRERLAALVTAPQNRRFAQVFVNRIWQQLIGAGLVEPVQDWEGKQASHPELLEWLARDFQSHGYDFRHLLRRLLTSQLYARQAVGTNAMADAESRFFTAPDRRRLNAEQIVDSMYHVAGVPMDVEELTFVHDGRRPINSRMTLGKPSRAWMMCNLANERDRPSLNLPRAAMVAEVMEAFGWVGSRQSSLSYRETSPTAIQPGVLANSHLTLWLSRIVPGSQLAELAMQADSPEQLTEELFLCILGRMPTDAERIAVVSELSINFEERLVPEAERSQLPDRTRLPLVTWFNHLQSEANTIQQEHERRVAAGPEPDLRFQPQWRERMEDAVWTLVNHREFVWMP